MPQPETAKPLDGLTLVANSLPPVPAELIGTQRGDVWGIGIESTVASRAYARELGAMVVPYEEGIEVGTQTTWMLSSDGEATHAFHAEQEMVPQYPNLLRVDSQPFAACREAGLRTQLRRGESFMLSHRQISLGHGKYRIDQEWQLDRFLQFLDAFQDGSNPLKNYAELFHVRNFIETPSGHYTSYRSLVTGSGEIIAATLHYSSHTKTTAPTVVRDARPLSGTSALDEIKNNLEEPDSPFYLGARDVRSNFALSRNCIPLMGGQYARTITPYQQEILQAHGIDPNNPQPPDDLVESAFYVGRFIAPRLDIVVGLDHLQDVALNKIHNKRYLETNATPGDIAFRECWRGGDPLTIETSTAMRTLALDAVAKYWLARNHKASDF